MSATGPFSDPRTGISAAYRTSAWRVFGAILVFIGLYLALLAFAAALLLGTGYAAVAIMSAHAGFLTLAASAGIFGLGVMFFLFVIKSIFAGVRHKAQEGIEINERDQPELIALVNEVADKLQAPRPKKVVLVEDVNASVSYDSTFWSLFLPVRKNLHIGLGLVNVLNVSELRAVLAHEFGHFSQRSMKLGSYVYTVNKVIHDLVAHRDGWDRSLQQWASAGGVFGSFAVITFHLVNGVREVLAGAYKWINAQHSGLSLQMEYQADALAASLTSSSALIQALYRTEYGNMAYEATLGELNGRLEKQEEADDVYSFQRSRIAVWRARDPSDDLEDLLGDVRQERVVFPQRLVIKDQWASHPSLDEREAHVHGLAGERAQDRREAWSLFHGATDLRQRMTQFLYRHVPTGKERVLVHAERSFNDACEERDRLRIAAYYQGFYDDRKVDLDGTSTDLLPASEIYTAEVGQRLGKLARAQETKELLLAIKLGSINVERFEFDGRKYIARDASYLLERLGAELSSEEQWLRQLDAQSVALNAHCADQAGRHPGWKQAMGTARVWQARVEQVAKILEKGMAVHRRLASKPRFQKDEWNSIGRDALVFCGAFREMLRSASPAELVANTSAADRAEALERFARSGERPTFEAEYFLSVLDLAKRTYLALQQRARVELKALTDLQLTWLTARVEA